MCFVAASVFCRYAAVTMLLYFNAKLVSLPVIRDDGIAEVKGKIPSKGCKIRNKAFTLEL